jgi:S1-C subfamily serine protease
VAHRDGICYPPPAYSAQVYQVIQPSLVLIQTEERHQNAESDFGLGSGVIVNSFGDILTSLHVIAGANSYHRHICRWN